MKRLGGGSIINFGSVSARIGSNFPAYMTAKAGAHGLTKGLARDLGPFNIRVNTLLPGWVMTERQRRELPKEMPAGNSNAHPTRRYRSDGVVSGR
nr:SDR family oxidoreductase [Mesorhizobium sp.]